MSHIEAPTMPVEVPFSMLSADTLAALIEAFILREGTDYGAHEASHEAKCAQVRQAIEHSDVLVIFDPDSESSTLMNRVEWRKIRSA